MRDRTDPPRLLFVSTVAVTIRHFLRPYADHFRARGWQVDAAANGMAAGEVAEQSFDNVYELPLSRSLRDLGGLIRGYRAVRQTIGSVRPDIVHVHTPIASFLVRVAVRMMPASRRPAVVYTAHGFHFHAAGRWLPNLMFRGAERLAGRWTDRLIVINDEDEEAAKHHRIVPLRKLRHLPGIGLDTRAYAPTAVDAAATTRYREALGLAHGVPFFVVIGEFSPNKRQADAIDALARMEHRDARLILVGDGPLRARLRALADERHVSDRVSFTGLIPDVPAILCGATALVATSAREGLSRSVMEALALEVPVIASSARGNRELVGDSGRIFQTGDVGALTVCMDWFVDHQQEGQELGRAGRRRMVDEYDLGPLLLRHEALYDELLAERRARPYAR